MSRSTLKDFDVISRLGAGSFGTVYKAKRIIDEKLYVMKVVRIGELSHRERSDAINEVQILAQLKSPFVVCYYDSFIEKENLHIVMEFCNRGDLQNLLRKAKERNVSGLKEPIVWNMTLQIILGLYYLHKKNILHRDLKSANVFLNKDSTSANYHLKIGDLGVAKLMDTSTALARTIVGTPYYLSPELCKDMPYRDKSDCWALGVIVYELCTLEHPFEARNQCALIMKIIESPIKPPPATNASPVLINLILWLLQKDPRLRPSIRDLLKEKEVRNRLQDEGLELPEELIDYETTNFLVNGLPIALPKEIEEKSVTEDGDDDGTISLMNTLVDAKDVNHRSFRVTAAALSAQSTNTRTINDNNSNIQSNNSNPAAPAPQRGPSGRFVASEGTGVTTTQGVPGPVKRTTSVSRTNSTSSVSSTSSTVASSAASTATSSAAMVGNRVRGVNRGRGRITSDKARMRYQRPPVASPATAPSVTTGNPVTVVVDEFVELGSEEGDEPDAEDEYDPGLDNENGIETVGSPVPVVIDAFADAKALDSHEVYGTDGAHRRPSVMAKELEGLRIAEEKAVSGHLAESKKQRADSSIRAERKAAIAAMDDDEEKYDSDFVPEEEDDQYDVSHPPAVSKPGADYKHTPPESKHASLNGATMSGSSSLPSYQHMMMQAGSSLGANHMNYNRSMMSTAGSEFGEHGTQMGNQTAGEDAEMWNSIWTEKRGMIGGVAMSNNALGRSTEKANLTAGDDFDTADGDEMPAAAVPIQEVEDMLVMARNKAIADLGEDLFSKIYSLLSRHMKQDHSGDGSEGIDVEQSLNLRMLQELETMLSGELHVHGVALVSDAVFRVRALLAFESKCSSFIPSNAAMKEAPYKNEVNSQQYRSDLPTVQVPWQQQQQQQPSQMSDLTTDVTSRRK